MVRDRKKNGESWVKRWPAEGKGGAERCNASKAESGYQHKTRRENGMSKSLGNRLQGVGTRKNKHSLAVGEPTDQTPNKPTNKTSRGIYRGLKSLCVERADPENRKRAGSWLRWASFPKETVQFVIRLPVYRVHHPQMLAKVWRNRTSAPLVGTVTESVLLLDSSIRLLISVVIYFISRNSFFLFLENSSYI